MPYSRTSRGSTPPDLSLFSGITAIFFVSLAGPGFGTGFFARGKMILSARNSQPPISARFARSIAVALYSVLLMSIAPAALAKQVLFDLPLKCDMGVDCFIQNYVDVDPSKGRKDYTCGELSYNKHKGTDFRVTTLKAMEAGVAVIAAADGIVGNLREGVDDHYFSKYDKETQKKVYNIGLGNVVILKHGDGWTSAYAHMRKGSIRVKKGDRVKRGDILGYVGLSGYTIFPHVHFAVRKRKTVIDPFSGPMKSTPCNMTEKSLWTQDAQKQLAYQNPDFYIQVFPLSGRKIANILNRVN